MKQRPIIFSTPMVQAIQRGDKTQTRRVIKPQPIHDELAVMNGKLLRKGGLIQTWFETGIRCPYGEPGSILYVRETWQPIPPNAPYSQGYFYKADNPDSWYCYENAWKSPRFMPKEAARLWLQITDVRAERLQDISEADAQAEGAECGIYMEGPKEHQFQLEINRHARYRDGFRFIWQSINGPGSWELNPWVRAITFKQIEKP